MKDAATEIKNDLILRCPICGGKARYYHSSDGITKAICENKCLGWKAIQEFDRRKK